MYKKKIDYDLPFKKLYYAHHNEDVDMYYRAKEEIAANNVVSRIRSLTALHKIKKEVAAAIKNNTVTALYEKWGKEVNPSSKEIKEFPVKKMILKEASVYCFEAKLEYLDEYEKEKGDCFIVPYQVLAEDQYQAKAMLLEWLSNPKQTGYKFKACVGLIPKPSSMVIMLDKKENEQVD